MICGLLLDDVREGHPEEEHGVPPGGCSETEVAAAQGKEAQSDQRTVNEKKIVDIGPMKRPGARERPERRKEQNHRDLASG